MMPGITIQRLKGALKRRDAPYFSGHLNLNLIGIRADDTQANTFNDALAVMYDDADGKTILKTYPITTDPGTYYRLHPINVRGTAMLKPGHYPQCWQIGAHRGKYRALVQRGLMTVYRDANRNGTLESGLPEDTGYFGINLHHSAINGYTQRVDRWSAGCQVFADKAHFDEVMALVDASADIYGDRFSYTLLTQADLK